MVTRETITKLVALLRAFRVRAFDRTRQQTGQTHITAALNALGVGAFDFTSFGTRWTSVGRPVALFDTDMAALKRLIADFGARFVEEILLANMAFSPTFVFAVLKALCTGKAAFVFIHSYKFGYWLSTGNIDWVATGHKFNNILGAGRSKPSFDKIQLNFLAIFPTVFSAIMFTIF